VLAAGKLVPQVRWQPSRRRLPDNL